jgi:hypothetical protein
VPGRNKRFNCLKHSKYFSRAIRDKIQVANFPKSPLQILQLMAPSNPINHAIAVCALKALAQTVDPLSITMGQTTYAWQRPSTIRDSYRNHYLVRTWCII